MMYYTSPYRIVDPNIGDYWVSDEENSAGMIWMKTFCFFESKYWKGETGIGDYDGIKFVVRLFHAMPEQNVSAFCLYWLQTRLRGRKTDIIYAVQAFKT